MVFRKIYWVVERNRSAGFEVSGVYTSIIDLIELGLGSPDVRLSLVKLDAPEGVLGSWDSSTFGQIRTDLNEFIATGEFSIEQCDHLAKALNGTLEAKSA